LECGLAGNPESSLTRSLRYLVQPCWLVMNKLSNHIAEDPCKPKIDYPCDWQYKIIGQDRRKILAAIKDILGQSQYTVNDSNVSSRGKYISMRLEVRVADESDRLKLYRDLAEHSAVKVVL